MEKEKLLERVLRLREASNVERCHNIRHSIGYPVGKHSFDMLLLLDILHPDPSIQLYQAIIRHDLHERWTGDLPAPVKSLDPELSAAMVNAAVLVEEIMGIEYELTSDDERWLKALDMVDFYFWALDEVHSGNEHVRRSLDEVVERIKSFDLPAEVQELFDVTEDIGWYRTDERL